MTAVNSIVRHIAGVSSTCGFGVGEAMLPSVRTRQGVGSHDHRSQCVALVMVFPPAVSKEQDQGPFPLVLGGEREVFQTSADLSCFHVILMQARCQAQDSGAVR